MLTAAVDHQTENGNHVSAEGPLEDTSHPSQVSHIVVAATVSTMDPVAYDRRRKELAKQYGIRVGTLDQLRQVGTASLAEAAVGRPLVLPDPEPWEEQVDGSILLDDLAGMVRRYVVLTEHQSKAIALWVVQSWVLDSFGISSILAVTSPEKGWGKSTLLSVLSRLVRRPLAASSITAAALYRTVEVAEPTLLIDELDAQLGGDRSRVEELRGILNSGHLRSGAKVIRCAGEDNEPRAFSTWCPKVLALIGRLPATLADRSIEIRMERKAPGEPCERLRGDQEDAVWERLRSKLARWAQDVQQHFLPAIAREDLAPRAPMSDRAADNWRPLLAIAETTRRPLDDSYAWRDAAEAAAVALTEGEEQDIGPMLLADMRTVFGDLDVMPSEDICEQLSEMEDRPWPEWRAGRPMTPRQLAGRLGHYGVKPERVRMGDERQRCYQRADLEPVWQRYLPTGTAGTDGTRPPDPPGDDQAPMDGDERGFRDEALPIF